MSFNCWLGELKQVEFDFQTIHTESAGGGIHFVCLASRENFITTYRILQTFSLQFFNVIDSNSHLIQTY